MLREDQTSQRRHGQIPPIRGEMRPSVFSRNLLSQNTNTTPLCVELLAPRTEPRPRAAFLYLSTKLRSVTSTGEAQVFVCGSLPPIRGKFTPKFPWVTGPEWILLVTILSGPYHLYGRPLTLYFTHPPRISQRYRRQSSNTLNHGWCCNSTVNYR